MAVLVCTDSFSYDELAGKVYVPRTIAAGDLVDEKDPAVKKAPQYFEPVEATSARATARRAGGVEQATAAPGEKRSVVKPKASDKG